MRVTVKARGLVRTVDGDMPPVERPGGGAVQLVMDDADSTDTYAIVTLTPTEALDLIDRLSAALGHGREVTAPAGVPEKGGA